jgi:hypothetical protein
VRTVSIEHDGKTWRAEFGVGVTVRIYADDALAFTGYMSGNGIRFWSLPEGYNDGAVCALERALASRDPGQVRT